MKSLKRIAIAALAVVALGAATAVAQPTPNNITGSTVNAVAPTQLIPGVLANLCTTARFVSPDFEYIDRFDLDLPDGWTIGTVAANSVPPGTACEQDVTSGTSAGNVVYWQTDAVLPTECGAWSGGSAGTDYTFCVEVTAADCTGAPWDLPWNIIGDTWGSEPHTVVGTYSSVTCLGEVPDIDVSPLSLAATQPADTTTQQALTIANTGEADLDWTIGEDAGLPPTRSVGTSPLRLGTPAPVQRSAQELADLIEAAMAQVVQDGSFEAGTPNPFWTEASTNFGTPLCTEADCGTGTGTGPLTGLWWVWFGGIASANEAGSVSQSVTIPSGGAAILSFWVEQFVCSGSASDYLEVNIDGNQIWQTTGADPACGVLGYRQITLDVSAYADGGAHTLEFNSETFVAATGTNFFVDDVTLEAGPCQQAIDIPWLSVAPSAGTTAAAGSTPVAVTFDSTGLAPGVYAGNLCVESNDPNSGPGNGTDLVVVPVELTVEDTGPGPSVLEIPTLGAAGAALFGLALAGLGLGALRRRRNS